MILHSIQTKVMNNINDVVAGLITAAEHQLTGLFNLGTGRSVSFNELVEILNAELGAGVEPEYVENPIPETVYVHDTCADTTAMQETTGWTPRISLEQRIERVCEQYKGGTSTSSFAQSASSGGE